MRTWLKKLKIEGLRDEERKDEGLKWKEASGVVGSVETSMAIVGEGERRREKRRKRRKEKRKRRKNSET